MAELRFYSKIEQIAFFLRDELARGRWEGLMPGRLELANELGLNARTVEEALRLLELDGVLIPQGAGKRRKIQVEQATRDHKLTIGFLLYDDDDRVLPYHIDLVHRLQDSGHGVVIADESIVQIETNLTRLAKVVASMNVDAWVVQAGPKEILQWFVEREKTVMAQFGRFHGLPIAAAGVKKIAAMRKAVRRLHALGHRRIIMLSREERRKPFVAKYEQAFLDELDALGIRTGSYNLPDWKNNAADFHRCIDKLFHHTPPTALFLAEARLFVAAQQHLASMGMVAPRDISLISDDSDVAFGWCNPPITHIHWDPRPVVNRIVRWADRAARRIIDKRQLYTMSEFVEGGTIGPAPKT